MTPVGRYIHPETPCATCVPILLMPINVEAFTVFSLCRNAVLRNPGDGKPYDVDIGAISSVVSAVHGSKESLVSVVNLMRHLLYEELM